MRSSGSNSGAQPSSARPTGVDVLRSQHVPAEGGARVGAALTTVASYLLASLEEQGTRVVFGVPGRAIHHVFKELSAPAAGARGCALRLIVARHEGGAAFMADGYARVSGRFGVCLTTAGPGATNSSSGVLVAQADGVPLLLLAGEPAFDDTRKGAFQAGITSKIHVPRMFEAITGFSAVIERADQCEHLLAEAFRVLSARRPEAAHLALPLDVSMKRHRSGRAQPATAFPLPRADQEWRHHMRSLLNSSHPLLMIGSGARSALDNPRDPMASRRRLDALMRAVERHALPVVTSPRAKGLFPEAHAMSLGSYGMACSEWSHRYVGAGLDGLVVVGSGLRQWATAGWDAQLAPRGALVHVDVDPTVPGRAYPGSTGIHADAADYFDALADCAQRLPVAAHVERRRRHIATERARRSRWSDPAARISDDCPIKPQRLMFELQQLLDDHPLCISGTNLFCDVGNVLGWAWHHLTLSPPHRLWCNTTVGAMGWANGAVIGGKLAEPMRPAIALLGDGAFLMNGTEISTAARHSVGAVWVVLFDNSMTMVAQGMAVTHTDVSESDWHEEYALGDPDLAAFARSLGAHAVHVHQPSALRARLAEALEGSRTHCQPHVVVVHVDPSERPPFPHLRNPE